MTLSGAPHDAGVENLTRLRLKRRATESGAKRLGDVIRDHLAETFGLDERWRGRGEEEEDEGEEDDDDDDEEAGDDDEMEVDEE